MESIEDDDQYMSEGFDDEEMEEMYEEQENAEEVIDYEEMKRDLELFQNADIVKEALEQDVDLVEYGKKIEADLMAASQGSVADYIAESAHFATLHRDIDTCDSLLAQIQDLLHVYQHDLSGVANEIRSLQSESVVLSQKLQNRREMDGMIRGFINKVAINPNMVKVLIEGEINDEYVATLRLFDTQLDYVEQDIEDEVTHVRTSEVKSIKEVKSDLNILKSQCSSRLKDHIYNKIKLITPDCDLETVQREELVGMAGIMAFLRKHIPRTFDDVKKQYMTVVKEIMMNRIKGYRELVQPHEMVMGSAEDPIVHTQNIVRSFLKKKSTKQLREYNTEGYELEERAEVLRMMNEKPMELTPLQEGDDPDTDVTLTFRSLFRLFMDSASSEYQFLKSFFGVEDSSLFDEEFKDVCKYVGSQVQEWIAASVDMFGVLLIAMQIQSLMNSLQNSEYPILVDFWLPLRDKVLARFAAILDKHIAALKAAQSQAKTMEITEALHYSVKRFAALSKGVYYLGHTFSDLLLEKGKWKTPVDTMSTEVAAMVEKFSEQINEEHITMYLLNTTSYVLDMWKKAGIEIDENNAVVKLFEERVELYLESAMSKHMTFLYDFVKKNEKKKGSALKLSSNEMKGLKLYKDNYKDGVAEMRDVIKKEVEYYTLEVYKMFVKMVTDYHSKYIQILGGTSFVKELVAVKHIVNEATKYCVEFE